MAVCEADPVSGDAVPALVQSLVDKSLVMRETTPDGDAVAGVVVGSPGTPPVQLSESDQVVPLALALERHATSKLPESLVGGSGAIEAVEKAGGKVELPPKPVAEAA